MMDKTKQKYIPPIVEVIEMMNECAVMVGSGTGKPGGIGNGGQIFSTGRSGRGSGYASSSDLEDLINDILTVED